MSVCCVLVCVCVCVCVQNSSSQILQCTAVYHRLLNQRDRLQDSSLGIANGAVHCSVLQCIAARRTYGKHIRTASFISFNVLQCMQRVEPKGKTSKQLRSYRATCCSVLQRVACVAACCMCGSVLDQRDRLQNLRSNLALWL